MVARPARPIGIRRRADTSFSMKQAMTGARSELEGSGRRCCPVTFMDPTRFASKSALSGIHTVVLTAFVLVCLAVADEILIPLALAALLTFLVAPLVTRLERWLGRVMAVLTVVIMLLCAAGLTGWVLSRQLIDLGAKLPNYKGNIQVKLRSFKLPPGGVFSRLSQMFEELKQDVLPEDKPDPGSAVVAVESSKGATASRPLEIARKLIAPLLGPIGTAGLVFVLLVFMLLQREDLRGRLIRLVGKGHISHTTQAMDDAGQRVSRFLLMQLVVNVTYGIAVGIGLSFIGIPSAILCATLATVLRFIPYVGPWIAATIPILLSLAVFDNWTGPLLTIALFIVLELLSNNLMEPLLYGASTGVSATALIVAAVFWTWIWGPIGLVLSTPLTVCLVVIGRHVPKLEFLSVLLSDDRPLTIDEECYHRLLAQNSTEANELVDTYLKKHSAADLYDQVLIPVLTRAELDERNEAIDEDRKQALFQSVRDLVEDTAAPTGGAAPSDIGAEPYHIACLPVRAERDELAAAMLAGLITHDGLTADVASAEMTAGELIEWTIKQNPNAVCISVVSPSTVVHGRYLCSKLRARLPDTAIVVGLWGMSDGVETTTKRLRASGADGVATSLTEAMTALRKVAGLPVEVIDVSIQAEGASEVEVTTSIRPTKWG